MTQTSPSPSFPLFPLSLPYHFPALSLPALPFPSLSSPGVWGQSPQWRGSGDDPRKKEIEIGFGGFWRIFVSERQLSSVSLFTYDPYIWGNSSPFRV